MGLRDVVVRVSQKQRHAHSASQLRAVLRRVDPECRPSRIQENTGFPVLSIEEYESLLPRLQAQSQAHFHFKLLPDIPRNAHKHMPELVADEVVEGCARRLERKQDAAADQAHSCPLNTCRFFQNIPSELRQTLLNFQVEGV